MSNKHRLTVSFEYFPARSKKAEDKLHGVVEALAKYQPIFQSVTFGAAGSTVEGTFHTAVEMQSRTGTATASHLTAVALPRDKLLTYADHLWDAGIKRLVALRGDLPEGLAESDICGPDFFARTPDFVAALKRRHDFDISVAAYPETHPRAVNSAADIDHLKAKFDAGADRAITQFFFDNEDFFRFRDAAKRRGVEGPIIPGILPIIRFESAVAFARKCGARIPERLLNRFANTAGNPRALAEVATEMLREQVQDLARNGVDHIHIYTLNRLELAVVATLAFRANRQMMPKTQASSLISRTDAGLGLSGFGPDE